MACWCCPEGVGSLHESLPLEQIRQSVTVYGCLRKRQVETVLLLSLVQHYVSTPAVPIRVPVVSLRRRGNSTTKSTVMLNHTDDPYACRALASSVVFFPHLSRSPQNGTVHTYLSLSLSLLARTVPVRVTTRP